MTKQEYLNALETIIKDAEVNKPILASILLTVSAAIMDDTLHELSDYTASHSLQQLIKYKAQQN